MLKTKRIYELPSSDDGERILVDRLWPRGISKEKARIDEWMKEIAPSDELRNWYRHEDAKWDEFRNRYFSELETKKEPVDRLRQKSRKKDVTLLFSTRAEKNNAVALKEYLEK